MGVFTILIVDDNSNNLAVLHYALNEAGYEVNVETDPRNVIDHVQSFPPDLILLDVMMPYINGFDICRQLKNNSLTASIPVIFMTALTNINDNWSLD